MDKNNEQFEVEFIGEKQKKPILFPDYENSTITKLVIKYSGGRIKNEKDANYFLIGFAVLITMVSLFLFLNSIGFNSAPSQEEIDRTLLLDTDVIKQ